MLSGLTNLTKVIAQDRINLFVEICKNHNSRLFNFDTERCFACAQTNHL